MARLVDAKEVAIGTGPEGPFAYRRSSLIIRHGRNTAARDRAFEVLSRLVEVEREESDELLRVEATDGRDLSPNIAPLAAVGVDVQHDHLFFATCSCCPPHPSVAWGPCGPLAGNPLWATGLAGNPLWATGLAGNPLWATGLAGNPLWATGLAGNPLWATVAGTFAGAGGRGYQSDAGTTAAPVVGPELQRLVARVGAAPTRSPSCYGSSCSTVVSLTPTSDRSPHGWGLPPWDRTPWRGEGSPPTRTGTLPTMTATSGSTALTGTGPSSPG